MLNHTITSQKSLSTKKDKASLFPSYRYCLAHIFWNTEKGYETLDLANDLMNKYAISESDVSVIIQSMQKKGIDLNNKDEKWLAQVMVKFGISKL